jgi:hypothetical protein
LKNFSAAALLANKTDVRYSSVMKRIWIAAALSVCLAVWGGSVALGDDTAPAPADTTVASPPTTSEFGTETEIEIALDDDGSIVSAGNRAEG